MFDSFTPLGGLVPLFLIQLGEVLPGGVGSGLYGILVFALLAVFVAGLMVGRTPEFLGKKVQAREIKLADAGGAGAAGRDPRLHRRLDGAAGGGLLRSRTPGRTGSRRCSTPTAPAAGNNGSAFGGLTADTPWLDTTHRHRHAARPLRLHRADDGDRRLARGQGRRRRRAPAPSRPHRPLFAGLLAGVILILGGLQFLPALALGPLAEHFAMVAGKTF